MSVSSALPASGATAEAAFRCAHPGYADTAILDSPRH
jgi:hypothetical protein